MSARLPWWSVSRRPSPFCAARPSPAGTQVRLRTLSAACWRVGVSPELRVCSGRSLTGWQTSAVDAGMFMGLSGDVRFSSSKHLWQTGPSHVTQHQVVKSGSGHRFGGLRVCRLPPTFPEEGRWPSCGCELAAPCTFSHRPALPPIWKVLNPPPPPVHFPRRNTRP